MPRTGHRTTLVISDEVLDAVRELATRRDITMTEVFRQAITTEKFLADAIASGDKIYLEGRGGRNRRQIILR
jgi:predicted transcriptional regulator